MFWDPRIQKINKQKTASRDTWLTYTRLYSSDASDSSNLYKQIACVSKICSIKDRGNFVAENTWDVDFATHELFINDDEENEKSCNLTDA